MSQFSKPHDSNVPLFHLSNCERIFGTKFYIGIRCPGSGDRDFKKLSTVGFTHPRKFEAPRSTSYGESSQFYHDGKIGWLLKSHLKG